MTDTSDRDAAKAAHRSAQHVNDPEVAVVLRVLGTLGAQLADMHTYSRENRKRITRQRNVIIAGYALLFACVVGAAAVYSRNAHHDACTTLNMSRVDLKEYNREFLAAKTGLDVSPAQRLAAAQPFLHQIDKQFAPFHC